MGFPAAVMVQVITRLMLLLLLLVVVIATLVIGGQSASRLHGGSDVINDGGQLDYLIHLFYSIYLSCIVTIYKRRSMQVVLVLSSSLHIL